MKRRKKSWRKKKEAERDSWNYLKQELKQLKLFDNFYYFDNYYFDNNKLTDSVCVFYLLQWWYEDIKEDNLNFYILKLLFYIIKLIILILLSIYNISFLY